MTPQRPLRQDIALYLGVNVGLALGPWALSVALWPLGSFRPTLVFALAITLLVLNVGLARRGRNWLYWSIIVLNLGTYVLVGIVGFWPSVPIIISLIL